MYNREDGNRIMIKIAEKVKKDVDFFAELDGLSGDGDLGETIEKVANVILSMTEKGEITNFGELFLKSAMAINKAAPSTLGTLISGGVMNLAKECKGKETLTAEEVAGIPMAIAKGIQEMGKANLGDKTILDALLPMGEITQAEFAKTQELQAAYKAGGAAAMAGAKSTAGMVPKAGRAQWIGERVKENLDGGAMVCASVAELFV